MKQFFMLTVVSYSVFVIHTIEESLRLGVEHTDNSILIPLLMYPVALIALYMQKRFGFWLAFLLMAAQTVISVYGHFFTQEDFIGRILPFWGQTLCGYGAFLAALLTSLFPIAGVLVGLKYLRKS